MQQKLITKDNKGFSLIELLAVILIVGILAAIAIPALSLGYDTAQANKAKRNAQSIAMFGASADLSGIKFDSLESAIRTITVTGFNASRGPFTGQYLKVDMSAEEALAASKNLKFHHGMVMYDPQG